MKRKQPSTAEELPDDAAPFSSAVIDLGAWKVTAGFSGDAAPQSITPTDHAWRTNLTPNRRFGLRHLQLPGEGSTADSFWEGGELQPEKAAASIDSILRHTLETTPEDRPLMLVDPPGVTDAQRRALVTALFESGSLEAIGIAGDAPCATFAVGAEKALVADAGHRGARFTVVYEGYILHRPSVSVDFGGLHAGQNWMDYVLSPEGGGHAVRTELDFIRRSGRAMCILPVSGSPEPSAAAGGPDQTPLPEASESEKEVLRGLAAVHPSFRSVLAQRHIHALAEGCAAAGEGCAAKAWQLPDGVRLNVSPEARLRLGSVYFMGGADVKGGRVASEVDGSGLRHPRSSYARAALRCIDACEVHLRPMLCANVLLKGGVSQQQGFAAQFEKDMRALLPSSVSYNCLTQPGEMPDHTSWLGASILASTSLFLPRMLTKAEYDEEGASAIDSRLAFC